MLSYVEHRRLILLSFSDYHDAVHGDVAKDIADGRDGLLVDQVLVPSTHVTCRTQRSSLSDTDQFHCDVSFNRLADVRSFCHSDLTFGCLEGIHWCTPRALSLPTVLREKRVLAVRTTVGACGSDCQDHGQVFECTVAAKSENSSVSDPDGCIDTSSQSS